MTTPIASSWLLAATDAMARALETPPTILALQAVCIATSVILAFASVPDMQAVLARRSAAGVPTLPFAAQLLTNLVGGVFSHMIGDGISVALAVLNIGLVLAYLAILTAHSASPRAVVGQGVAATALAVGLVAWILTSPASDGDHAEALGVVSTITVIAFAAAPLASLRTVLANRDASIISAPLAATLTLCSAAWTAYGFVLANNWVILQNAVNTALGALQVALVLAFPAAKLPLPALTPVAVPQPPPPAAVAAAATADAPAPAATPTGARRRPRKSPRS